MSTPLGPSELAAVPCGDGWAVCLPGVGLCVREGDGPGPASLFASKGDAMAAIWRGVRPGYSRLVSPPT
jgi:hypothetical protein